LKIFVLGANGFIGSHLIEKILAATDWAVVAFDLRDENMKRIGEGAKPEQFFSYTGDIFKEDSWIEKQVAACDVVLPLAGIAQPAYYLSHPLWTFELDFEQNLDRKSVV
jgi:nucleoside-diphosphate-sugar epimerase